MKCVLVALVLLSGLSFLCLTEESKNTAIIGSISTGAAIGGRGRVVKPKAKYDVRWSKVSHKQRRKVTISQVTPPLPEQKTKRSNPQKSEDLNVAENPLLKHSGTYTLFAKVYDHRFTKIEWEYGGEKFVALSNIDFNYMNGFTSFEGRGKTYSFMLSCNNASLDELKINGEIPSEKAQILNGLNKQDAAYTIVQGNPETEKAMEFIEALHDLHAAKKDKLKQAHRARMQNDKLRRKLDRRRRDSLPPKPDLTIYFWKRDVEDEKRQRLQARGVSQ